MNTFEDNFKNIEDIYTSLIQSNKEHLAAEFLYNWIVKGKVTQCQFEILIVHRDTIRLNALKNQLNKEK
jgi:hypothetical protein